VRWRTPTASPATTAESQVLRRLEALAGTRRENFDIVAASRDAYAFDGLGPSMLRQLEQRPMHRNHRAAAYLDMSLDGELGAQVIVGPSGVVLAGLDQRNVEGSEARAAPQQQVQCAAGCSIGLTCRQ
jgi:hypothetical protein